MRELMMMMIAECGVRIAGGGMKSGIKRFVLQ
jgi:hypothetical protein